MKRVFAFLLSLVLLCFFGAAFASAAGETVQVTFQFTSEGAYAHGFKLSYDEELTYVSATASVGFAGPKGWSNAGMSPVYSGTCTYTFKIADDAADGVYFVNLSLNRAVDANYNPVSITFNEKERVFVGEHTHTYDPLEAVAATCLETGLTAGTFCPVCDTVLVEQEEVPALGHDIVVDPAVAPTCTETGLTAGEHCSRCDEATIPQTEVPAAGHDYKAVVTEPTCTEEGYTTHTCAVCGDDYTDSVVAAAGHKYEAVVTAPTCTEAGYTTYTCSVCEDTYTADEVPATGHDYEAVVTAPTCEAAGYTTYTCACGDTYTADEVAANGHGGILVSTNVIPATCEKDGQNAFVMCLTCGKAVAGIYEGEELQAKLNESTIVIEGTLTAENFPEELKLPAKGHGGFLTSTNVIPATCEEDGQNAFIMCLSCHKVCVGIYEGEELQAKLNESTIVIEGSLTAENCPAELKIPATGHTEEILPAVEPTYTETGLTEGKKCSVCGEILVAQEVVPVLKPLEAPKYTVEKVSDTRGKVTYAENENSQPLEEVMVKITWSYTLSNGDSIGVILVRDVKEDGTFKLSGIVVPEDSVLDFVHVEVINNEDADEMDRGTYDVFGQAIL